MEVVLQDLRVGWRNLSRQKGFALLAVATLALGIGFNSAIFSVVNSVLLAPLEYPQGESLVWMFGRNSQNSQARVSPPDFVDYQAQQSRFESFASFLYSSGVLGGAARPERVRGAGVSAQFFDVLGVQPLLGRIWTEEEFQEGFGRLLVISHSLWQRQFGADASVVGKEIRFDGRTHTLLGVMPAGFGLLPLGPSRPVDFWTPLDFKADNMQVRRFHFLLGIGRLKPGETLESAQEEMDAIALRLERLYPDSNQGWGLNLIPLQEQLVGNLRPALVLLEVAVGLVLLIACANIANLLLARSSGRRREMALRTALGAQRTRLVRQLLTESLLLSLMAGSAGLLLSAWGLNLILGLSPGNIPRLENVSLDQQVLFFTLAVSILTGLLFGLLPALTASRTDLNQDLKQGGQPNLPGRRSGRTRSSLVVAEVALAILLLAGTGLLLKSFVRLLQVDPGFDFDNILTLQITPSPSGAPDRAGTARFYQSLVEEVRNLPGVKSAGLADRLPLVQGGSDTAFAANGGDLERSQDRQYAYIRLVSPGYFRSMGIPVLRGRSFEETDQEGAPVQAVVSQSLAQQVWPDEDPIGKQMTIDLGEAVPAQVAGVVGSVRHSNLAASPWQTMYLSFFQVPGERSILNLAARTANDPLELSGPIQSLVSRLDREAALSSVQTMKAVLDGAVARPRFNLWLLSAFSLLALLLAAVGIFAVMSQSVSMRRREIGIRMALGAQRNQVVAMVVREGMRLALLGSFLGLATALALGRFLSSLLFQVAPHDPLTLAVVTSLLLGVALAANLWPARRAGSLDPMLCLRYE